MNGKIADLKRDFMHRGKRLAWIPGG
jgi:hypothetical protein